MNKLASDPEAMSQIVEEVGQTIVEHAVKKQMASTFNEEFEDSEENESETGKLKDLISKLKPKSDDTEEETSNPLVKTLVIIGVILVSTGLITAFFVLLLGLFLIFLGALPIVIAVFAPIGTPQKSA